MIEYSLFKTLKISIPNLFIELVACFKRWLNYSIAMQKVIKKRAVIDENGYELSKKVMRKLIEKEKSV